jgi:transposase-like protein
LYKVEYAKFAEPLAKLGTTDSDLADAFDVKPSTIRLWRNKYPEFNAAWALNLRDQKIGKLIACIHRNSERKADEKTK